jgi:hypothetical protein
MEVKAIRLLSGEDLVAKVEYNANDVGDVRLYNPIVVIPQQDGRIGFAQWPLFADHDEVVKNGVVVSQNVIVMTYTLNSDILNTYNSAAGGLIVPKKPSLILG